MARVPAVYAFYLPQYHAIPENDAWWGPGFTDWVNVRRSRPLFRGHYQPREPAGDNYYDLSDPRHLRWQVDLARSHGIRGFCHYHYWFGGKQLLERPTNLFMADRTLDHEFCLVWANETWSKRWDGMDHHILQLQTHEPRKELWENHFQYLIRVWTDSRAILVRDRPLFVIYRPHKIEQLANMLDYWRTRAREHGIGDLCFLTMKQFGFVDEDCLRHFDGHINFQPFEAMHSLTQDRPPSRRRLARFLPATANKLAEELAFRWQSRYGKPAIYDYDETWERIVRNTRMAGAGVYPGAFVDWDNSPRYGRRARVYSGANPERFGHWMRELLHAAVETPLVEPFIFLNAWNEWAEGTYLEPDKRHGQRYLEALRDALAEQRPALAVAES